MSESRTWTVRDAVADDVLKIYTLATDTYGHDPSTLPVGFGYDHLVCQLVDNPAGLFRACVAEENERLVGFYGVIPMGFYCNGEKRTGSLSLLTMTHPDYQRQGIFTTLASRLYDQLGQSGIPLTYGFPNENSLPGFIRKLQWLHVATLGIHVRPLNPSALARSVLDLPGVPALAGALLRPIFGRATRRSIPSVTIRQVSQFDDRADELAHARKDNWPIHLVRDRAYLNWRYVACPDWEYTIWIAEDGADLLGYLVLRTAEQFGLSGGMIMDLAAVPGRVDVLLALIDEAVIHSQQNGLDLVACLLHGESEGIRALRRSRFLRVPRQLDVKKWYFGARLNNDHLSANLVGDAQSWLLSFGDDDVL